MIDKQINISRIVKKVNSKYLLVMIAAKRSRQLSLLEQKEKMLKEEPDKLKSRPELENIGLLTEEERIALQNHKPIIVALDELIADKITYSFNGEE